MEEGQSRARWSKLRRHDMAQFPYTVVGYGGNGVRKHWNLPSPCSRGLQNFEISFAGDWQAACWACADITFRIRPSMTLWYNLCHNAVSLFHHDSCLWTSFGAWPEGNTFNVAASHRSYVRIFESDYILRPSIESWLLGDLIDRRLIINKFHNYVHQTPTMSLFTRGFQG